MQKRTYYLFPNHLLCFMTSALIGGIWTAHCKTSLGWNTVLLIFLLFLTYRYAYHPFNYVTISIFLVIMSSLIGYGRYRYQTISFEQLYTQNDTFMACRAHVDLIEPSNHKRFKWIVTLTTQTIKTHQLWTDAIHTLQVYTSKKPHLFVGDLIELSDLSIKKPNNFEFNNYLKKEKIGVTFFVPFLKATIVHRPFINLKRSLAHYKSKLIHTLESKLSTPTFTLFCTIFLGKKSNCISSSVKQDCKIWGISHYLARSGLHLVFFILIWHFFLNLLQLKYRTKSLVLILIALTYYMLSWTSISFNRAFFTFLLRQLGTFFLLPTHISYLLVAICFGTLINNPYQLFFLDFQLSFSLALSIAWFNQISHQRQRQPQLKIS